MARILVIEDDAPVREVIRRMLQNENHDVLEASDGSEGIEIFRREKPDLIILDILMPVKEGLETTKEIRRISQDVKIIAISGGGAVKPGFYLDLAKKLGADHAFEKPFTWKQMLESVNRLTENNDSLSVQ